jgi:hypothetical protein
MKNENKLKTTFSENVTELELKHFIYLNRDKLNSYSSQLFSGLVQLKKIVENKSNTFTDIPPEKIIESNKEENRESEISVGPKIHMGGASAKSGRKSITKTTSKEVGISEKDEFFNSYQEEIADYDNLYLKLESLLIERGFLTEIKKAIPLNQYPQLIKIKGIARFIDWNNIFKLMRVMIKLQRYNEQFSLEKNLQNSFFDPENAGFVNFLLSEELQDFIHIFSLENATLHLNVFNQVNIISSLDEKYFCMSPEQLKTSYIMSGDVEVIVVGLLPEKPNHNNKFGGIADQVDMKLIWQEIMGKEIDLVIEPLAIYTEIHPR